MMKELFKRISQDLFYVEYDDFDFDIASKLVDERYRPNGPFCSGVRKGNFAGRNFDSYEDYRTVLVVRVGNNCARYSSIGVLNNFVEHDLLQVIAAQEKNATYSCLPQLVTDGINEKGLLAMNFMVPNAEASEDTFKWGGREWGKSAAFTNPFVGKTLNTVSLNRFVLDNAASVDEAIELIRGVDWFDPDKFTSSGAAASFRWMLSDSQKAAFVECIDNDMKISVTEEISGPSAHTISTNFSQYLFGKGIIQDGASGYERFDQMVDMYNKESDGIDHILRSVFVSEKYKREISDKFFFSTDYMWDESPTGRHFTASELYKGNARSDSDFKKTVELAKSRFRKESPRPSHFKQNCTVFTSVYDFTEKSVRVLLGEGSCDRIWHEFKL